MRPKLSIPRTTRPALAALCALLGAGLALPGAAHAEKRALLIGVGHYDNAVWTDLPAQNDLDLMLEVTKQLDIARSNVRIAASFPDGAMSTLQPDAGTTRHAILSELDRLADTTKAGDQVLIYYSGHGIQVPDQAEGQVGHDEADDFDEAIVPSDTAGEYDPKRGELANAIRDDDLDLRLTRIRAKGASVWFIVDSCHSGTALRSGPQSSTLVLKSVPAELLGIPKPPRREKTKRARYSLLSAAQENDTGITAFYAVPSDLLAPVNLWSLDGQYVKTPFSLLTFSIHAAIARGHIRTYEELAQAVRLQYQRQSPYDRGGPRILPQFDGDMQRAVLGDGSVRPVSWPVLVTKEGLKLQAGQLDFLSQGAELRVLDLAHPEDPRLYRAKSVSLAETSLEPVDAQKAFTFKSYQRPELRAELLANPVSLTTRVALVGDAANPLLVPTRTALGQLARDPQSAIALAPSVEQADLTLSVGTDRIWIAPAGQNRADLVAGSAREPLHIACSAQVPCAQKLDEALLAMARGSRILRVLGASANGNVTSDLRVETLVHVRDVADTSRCGSWQSLPGDARFAPYSAANLPSEGLPLTNCDQIYVRITYAPGKDSTNAADRVVDVTPLYLGVDGTLGRLLLDRDSVRLRPGESMIARQRAIRNGPAGVLYPLGSEQVAIIAVEQKGDDPVRDFSWLAMGSGAASVIARSRGDADPLLRALGQAAAPTGSRAAVQSSKPTGVVIVPIDFRLGNEQP